MRLSDSTLGWFLALTAMLLVVAVLLVVLRARLGRARVGDSWERSEERRRRKETVYGSASYLLLFCCAAVAGALSFHGLVGFGLQNLGLSGGWEYLVPFGLDGAAMFCSVLAVREASHGDAALGSRSLVWLFAAASAWFNWVHAPRGIDHHGAPQFFAGMSLSAAILFDRALKQTRKAALREQGLVPRPLPQIRVVRWLRAPRETYAAWSLMLLENVRSLDEAVDEVREDKRARLRERGHPQPLRALGGSRRVPQLPRPSPAARDAGPGEPAIGAAPDRVFDLTAEDDTVTLPRASAWDSLEQKLKDLEKLYG
ncbi:DUF2637 domain-containing protein [Streptacidiphilus rugosus]|uniref:DUF2637 domain-containing protein n=1 Tax=Streptacidiphilus rugosus TaxID=405783 RepID=UPI00056B59B3|nr:DUF2637 domain-containing protein [Streptacidiphilus rugosus]